MFTQISWGDDGNLSCACRFEFKVVLQQVYISQMEWATDRCVCMTLPASKNERILMKNVFQGTTGFAMNVPLLLSAKYTAESKGANKMMKCFPPMFFSRKFIRPKQWTSQTGGGGRVGVGGIAIPSCLHWRLMLRKWRVLFTCTHGSCYASDGWDWWRGA